MIVGVKRWRGSDFVYVSEGEALYAISEAAVVDSVVKTIARLVIVQM